MDDVARPVPAGPRSDASLPCVESGGTLTPDSPVFYLLGVHCGARVLGRFNGTW
jgi:hypothetical protein